MLYDVIEHLKGAFTLGRFTRILQRSIEDSGGHFVIRREVFSNLFCSFCRAIRSDPSDHVCPRSRVESQGHSSCETQSQPQFPACCRTIALDGVLFAPQMERDDGARDDRPTQHVPRQLRSRRYYLITDSGCRQLLLRWARLPVKGPLSKMRSVEPAAFNESDHSRLASAVSSNASFLFPLLKFRGWMCVPISDSAALGFFRLFIRCVACAHPAYPIITGFHEQKRTALASVAQAFTRCADLTGFATHVATLAEFGVPAFGDLISHPFLLQQCTSEECGQLIRVMGDTLTEMLRVADAYHGAVRGCTVPEIRREPVSRDDDLKRGASFAPALRWRLASNLVLPSESSHGRSRSQRPTCEYYYPRDRSSFFLPCVVLLWCLCGMNIGFQFYRSPESVTSVTLLFLERFPYLTMPWRLYYDFSCGLMRSVVGSAPWHFERTAFVHDPMHGKGHCSSCSPAYDVKFVVDASTRQGNSVIAEQRNSQIRQWAKTIEFMTVINATTVMTVLLASMNADLKYSMAPRESAMSAVESAKQECGSSSHSLPPVSPPSYRASVVPSAPATVPVASPAQVTPSAVSTSQVEPPVGMVFSMFSSDPESAGAIRASEHTLGGFRADLRLEGADYDDAEVDDVLELSSSSDDRSSPDADADDDEYISDLSDDDAEVPSEPFAGDAGAASGAGPQPGVAASGQKRSHSEPTS